MQAIHIGSAEAVTKIDRYDVIVGRNIWHDLSQLAPLCQNRKTIVVVDKNVQHAISYYLDYINAISTTVTTIISPFDGEENKSYAAFEFFCEAVLSAGLNRSNTTVVIIGGGAIGDSVHFVAGVLMRGGAQVIRIPTTLLSMVDSSIGGKVGINSNNLKNMIGMIHMPALVMCDTSFLDTLSLRELLSGYAEILKCSLIADRDAFVELENSSAKIGKSIIDKENADWLISLIKRSIEIKNYFVKGDETDITGQRAVLNFGHTIGHAIEKAEHNNCLHGEAVAMGIYIEANISHKLDLLDSEELARIKEHVQKVGLWNPGLIKDPLLLLQLMSSDKKISKDSMIELGKNIYCQKTLPVVIMSRIGSVKLNTDVDYKIVLKCLVEL